MATKAVRKKASTKRRKINTAIDRRFVQRHQRAPLNPDDHSEASVTERARRNAG